MFEDLRQQADDTAFEEEEKQDAYSYKDQARRSKRGFLGMTAPQRFVISVMLLLMTCMLSTLVLLVTEKIYLPGF
jgi:hypothetical protein